MIELKFSRGCSLRPGGSAKVPCAYEGSKPCRTISPGTTVTWTNHDDVPHVVASDTKIFKSQALDTDDHFSYTFTKPGTYLYYCMIHPKMTAKVVVQ